MVGIADKPNGTRRKLIWAMVAGGLTQGCGGGGDSQASPAVPPSSQNPLPSPVGSSGPSLAAMSQNTIYIAHRGSAALYPEQTFEAYDLTLDGKQFIFESDVQTIRDNTLVLMHDITVDRTTTSSGSVANFTQTEWRMLNIDANSWHGSAFGNALKAPTFQDWVERYRGKVIFVPEDKDLRSTVQMISIFNEARVSKDQVLFQAFSLDPLRKAVQSGFHACFLHTGQSNPEDAIHAGVRWTGIGKMAADRDILRWINSGIKTLIWTVNRRAERDAKLKLGVAGFFSDDPTYLSADEPLSRADKFDQQTWMPGMLSNNVEDAHLSGRGRFLGSPYWGYATDAAGYLGCLQGYLGPIKGSAAEPQSFNLELTINFDSAFESDQRRWASVFLATDDLAFTDTADASMGYHIIFRKSGVIEVYRKSQQAAALLLQGVNGSAILDGQAVRFRISVSSSSIKAARIRDDGMLTSILEIREPVPKLNYVHLGRKGLACRFSKLSLT